VDRVLTKKGAVVELAIVTAGVLIALSFDGVRGLMNDRSRVAEARINLAREIRDNKVSVENLLKTMPDRKKELERFREIGLVLRSGKPVQGEAGLDFGIPTLTSASRSTAEITGAFGLMDYGQVTPYAHVYSMQEKFERLLDEWLTKLQPVLTGVRLIEEPSPQAAKVDLWLRDIDTLETHVFFVGEYAQQLAAAYGKVLADER
jgi:hypothetical protein